MRSDWFRGFSRFLPLVGVLMVQVSINGRGILWGLLITVAATLPTIWVIATVWDQRVNTHRPEDSQFAFSAVLDLNKFQPGTSLPSQWSDLHGTLKTRVFSGNQFPGHMDMTPEGLRWRPGRRARKHLGLEPLMVEWTAILKAQLSSVFGRAAARILTPGTLSLTLEDQTSLEFGVQRVERLQRVFDSIPIARTLHSTPRV